MKADQNNKCDTYNKDLVQVQDTFKFFLKCSFTEENVSHFIRYLV